MPNGDIDGDCYYDNELSMEGLELVTDMALTWSLNGKFAGQKQFVLFRKCGE